MKRLIKKPLTFICTFTLMLSLAGCGGESETVEASNASSVSSENVTADGDNSQAPSVQILKDALLYEAQFIAGSDAGYAVVYKDEAYVCCNGKGEILGEIANGEPYACTTSTGHTLVDLGDEFGVVDKTGTLVFSESSLGVSGFTMPQKPEKTLWYDYVIPSMQDGYLMVYRVEENYESVVYSIGVVNMNGEWVSPLSSSHPILKTSDNWNETKIKRIVYAGCDAFTFCNYIAHLDIYNIKTNKTSRVELELGISSLEEKDFKFINGKTIWKNTYYHETQYYYADVNGKSGCFLVGEGSGRGGEHSKSAHIDDEYFWIDGELWDRSSLTKLSKDKYNLHYEKKFLGGYEPVIVENSAGTEYFGLKNQNGYKFEPIKTNFSGYGASFYPDGNYVLITLPGTENEAFIYDYNGNKINHFDGETYASFRLKNGIVRHYHASSGAKYFKATDSFDPYAE